MSRREIIPCGFAFLISFLLILLIFNKIVLPLVKKSTSKTTRELAILSIIIGAFLVIVAGRPPQNYRLLPLENLKIQTLLEKNPLSAGSHVVLKGFDTRLYDISYSSLELEGEWTRVDNTLSHISPDPAAINWHGKSGSRAVLYFETGPEAGMVTIAWNGREQTLDLYSETAGDLAVEQKFQISFLNFLPGYLAIFFLGAILFFSLSLYLLSGQSSQEATVKISRYQWLMYAFPMVIVWGTLLLAFWPGMMSPDSMDQWGQLSSGIFDDSHPIAHTLLMWLITRIWFSPAAVAIFQILFLTLTVAWGIGVLRQNGLPNWGAWLLSLVFALSPINGNMVITLWKDIPYSTALVLFSIFFLQIIKSRGGWLHSNQNCVWFILAGLMIALFRHNGFPVPIISSLVLILLTRYSWKRISICLGIILVLWFGIRGVFYERLDVNRNSGKDQAIFLHSLAAYVVQEKTLDEVGNQIVDEILPRELWTYDCCSIRTTYQNDLFSWDKVHLYAPEIKEQLQKFIIKNPKIEVQHLICSSSLVWEIKFRCGLAGIPPYNPSSWIVENPYGLSENSLLPALAQRIGRFLITLRDNQNFRLLWSPGLFLYIGIYCAWIFARRTRSWKMALFMLPALVQSGILMAVNISADQFRYQFGVYLIGLYALGLLMIKADPSLPTEPK